MKFLYTYSTFVNVVSPIVVSSGLNYNNLDAALT